MVITANVSEPQSGLVPSDTNEMGGGRVIRQIFEGLVSYDATGNMHYEVAKSITPNEDATFYEVELNEGWTFSNGEPVTSESFTKAWSFAANIHNAQKQASRMSIIEGYDELQDESCDPQAQLSGLTVIDDTHFTIQLNSADSVFPVQIAHQSFFPLPSVAYEDIDAFGESPIGNGPYKFSSWEHEVSISIVPNETYQGSRIVRNDGITFVVYTSTDAAYSDVIAGNLDLLEAVPQSALGSYHDQAGITAYSQAGSSYQGFIIPYYLEHFGNDEEGRLRRQAISMSINRGQIIGKVFYGTKTAASDFTSPAVPEHADYLDGSENLFYNPEKAQELWAQADAISQFTGTFKIAYNADSSHQAWVDAVCNQITNVLGIEALGDPYATFSDLRNLITERTITTAFRSGWALDYPTAEDYLTPLYASTSADGRGSNDGDYKSEEFDVALALALAQTDEDKRQALFDAAQEILLRDLPSIPLWNDNVAAVTAQGVANVQFDYTNYPTYYTITKE